jgi:putative nucleotidyltransferase with HDIG domain
MVGTRLTQEHREKLSEHARSEARGEELSTLNRIDKMILSGAGEAQSIQEITRFVLDVTGAHFAGVVTPAPDGTRELNFQGHYRNQPDPWIEEHLPYEGVTGWAITHGRTSWTRDILADSRYQRLAEIARERGIRSTAAAAIVLDGAILGALVTGHDEVHDFTSEELATLERLADQAAVAVTNARQRETLQRMALDTAMVLSNVIESRDAYTGDHCIRLVDYVEVTAKALGLNGRDVDLVKLGAAMHDVGKIAVPDDVLKKPDKLTPDEYTLIKQHCYVGGQICKKVAFLEPVYPMVYYHHEHFDGRGYPDGIAGDKIPLGARIIAVADAFDAMTNDRPYRRSIGHDRAVDTLMTGAGTQWDPEIVRCFLKTISQTHTDAQIA